LLARPDRSILGVGWEGTAMAPKWSERPKTDRWAVIGAFGGMAIAAVVSFVYLFEADTIYRYLTMSAGLIGGGACGYAAAYFRLGGR
jgi:hypothetical protein